MQRCTRLLSRCILVAALLPATTWGHGFSDYHTDRRHGPYAGPASADHYRGAVKLQTGKTRDGYHVRIYMAGIRPDDVRITPQNHHLILHIARGRRHDQKPGMRRASRMQMSIRRQMRLPYDADFSSITTSTSDGFMEIFIPSTRQRTRVNPSLAW